MANTDKCSLAHADDDEEAYPMLGVTSNAHKRMSFFQRYRKAAVKVVIALAIVLCILLVLKQFVKPIMYLLFILCRSASTTVKYLEPQFYTEYGSRRVQMNFGPYLVPGRAHSEGMFTVLQILPSPCADCLVTYMQSGLEYVDGTIANTNTGMWLHHTVLTNLNAQDITCPNFPQRFFASGNERTPTDLTANGTSRSGYYLDSNFLNAYGVELMTTNRHDSEVYVTMVYEYIPMSRATDFRKVTAVWFDIAGCNDMPEMPAREDSSFTYSSTPWISESIEGSVVAAWSHLHDGGTHSILEVNNRPICDFAAEYGQASDFVSVTDGKVTEHLSNFSPCSNATTLSVGDVVTTTAFYNTSLRESMRSKDGSIADIMGVTMMYIA